LGHSKAIVEELWPEVDHAALKQNESQIVVQVNGKLRAKILVSAGAESKDVEEVALADENVYKFIEGKSIIKTVFVPDKLVNIVVR
jgi:leucyl-tRNA synthetase